jgi:tRNA(fMet)-specific endonuclease VapC
LRYLLDTNAVIHLLKAADTAFGRRLRRERPEDVALSAIVTYELHYGAFRSARVEANLERLGGLRFEVLPFDLEDSISAGQVQAVLQAAGAPIGP